MRLANNYPSFLSILIFRCEEGILFLCSVLYAWYITLHYITLHYITFILRKCVPIKLTMKNVSPRTATLLRRRPADVEVICEHAAEADANGR